MLFYPTPALESLTLEYVKTNRNDERRRRQSMRRRGLLPFSPKLQTCTLIQSFLLYYPDISAAQEVTIVHPRNLAAALPMIELGMAVEKLALSLPFRGRWTWPDSLPQLRIVDVWNYGPQCNFETVQAPHLYQATLRMQNVFWIPEVLPHTSFFSTATDLAVLDEIFLLVEASQRLAFSHFLSGVLSLVHLRANEVALREILILVRTRGIGRRTRTGLLVASVFILALFDSDAYVFRV
ncbi:SubName: Full=Uncharacterized protein {ECO:0000313/EMBL:CCA74376.1} [Serendipita indica DSM 11827]|nr:SubName: Full=Uncharacterized protein {ECO:0000313/EMBL:CCA74376.1} [Serendipita indica DSM 11827]